MSETEIIMTEEMVEKLKKIFFDYGDGIKVETKKLRAKLSASEFRNVQKTLDICSTNGIVDKQGAYYWLVKDVLNHELLMNVGESYFDHDGTLRLLSKLYNSGQSLGILLVGDAGTGKTQLVHTLVGELMEKGITNGIVTVNGSDGTKERDLIGMIKVKGDGKGGSEFVHLPAGIATAMLEGKAFYLDEANTIPPGILVRLDQALDKRQVLTIPLSEDNHKVIRPKKGFMVIATVNPLTVVGTRSMPAQLFSRFGIVKHMRYPDKPEDEVKIVLYNTKANDRQEDLLLLVRAIHKLRNKSHAQLPYRPTIRESIACHKCLIAGLTVHQTADLVLTERGYHWSEATAEKIRGVVNLVIGRKNKV